MENQTHSSKAFLDVILDSMNDAVTGISREGTVLYWNRVAERLYGIPREKIIGRRIGEFFQRGSIMLFQVMETGCPVNKLYHQPCPDMHVLINAVPIFDEAKVLIGAVAIEQDISHTVQLSKELYKKPERPYESRVDFPFVCRNSNMLKTANFVHNAYSQDVPLLFHGEEGVGKLTLAHLAHKTQMNEGNFIVLNCSIIPNGFVESELFGYEEGLLGGARNELAGQLEHATGGTLFLRNIEALPLATQIKLAETVREKKFRRIGGTTEHPLRCKILGSSSAELEEMIANHTFSKQLYYSFHTVLIPPLRERREDIPELCNTFLQQADHKLGQSALRLASEVVAALTTYHWPGNLHELRSVIKRLEILANGQEVKLEHLPDAMRLQTLDDLTRESLPLASRSEEMERSMIEHALRRSFGNKASAARLLGISRGSLYYKMKLYNLDKST